MGPRATTRPSERGAAEPAAETLSATWWWAWSGHCTGAHIIARALPTEGPAAPGRSSVSRPGLLRHLSPADSASVGEALAAPKPGAGLPTEHPPWLLGRAAGLSLMGGPRHGSLPGLPRTRIMQPLGVLTAFTPEC